MLIHDIVPSQIVLEWGRRPYSGTIFGQRYYEYMVMAINRVQDEQVRRWLTDWLADLFQADNGKFSRYRFETAVAEKRRYNASPRFEQRHFYYLADRVKRIDDREVRQFVTDWLAEVAGGTNPQFKRDRWNQYCGKQPEPRQAVRPATLDEQGGPGFGSRGHGGFGRKFLRKSHYLFIAGNLHDIGDKVVRDHLTKWFEKVFTLDNPSFSPKWFEEQVVANGYATAIWQQRHFYFLAHEVAEIEDIEERTFVCNWLSQQFKSANEYFLPERWKEYCHLKPEHHDRRYVAHTRAKARGDAVIPETPWQERQRLERDAATQLTPEAFHRVATCYAEHQGNLAGHDLVYLRKTDGEYVVYDKTTGEQCWAVGHPNAWAAEPRDDD